MNSQESSLKATYKASSDIAFVKYWGKKDPVLRLPENGSIAMVLEGLDTLTTVAFLPELERDQVTIGEGATEKEIAKVSKHLDRLRQLAGVTTHARVVSKNSFPRSTGLSSSSSGFAALTFAAGGALGLNLSQKELSIMARQGSGSACRASCGGFVEWHDGDTSETSYAETIFPANHWDVRDVVAVVDEGAKRVSTTEGHESAQSSIFYAERQKHIKSKLDQVRQAIERKEFQQLGTLVEAEALEFHSILLTSVPPLIAWYPGTLAVMLEVQKMRSEGIQAYFTINTGFNVHVLTLPEYEQQVQQRLDGLALVQKTLTAKVGTGPEKMDTHLF